MSDLFHGIRSHELVRDRRRIARVNRRAAADADREGLVLRVARSDDRPALERLARLDSSPRLASRLAHADERDPVLVAEVDGELRSALALADGAQAADPFHRTAGLAALLRARAGQLSLVR